MNSIHGSSSLENFDGFFWLDDSTENEEKEILDDHQTFYHLIPGLDPTIPQYFVNQLPLVISLETIESINKIFLLTQNQKNKILKQFRNIKGLEKIIKFGLHIEKFGENYYALFNYQIGKGSFKTIKLAQNIFNNQLVAYSTWIIEKEDPKSLRHSQNMVKEIEIQKSLKDKRFVQIFESEIDKESPTLMMQRITMEYCHLGDLKSYLSRHSFEFQNNSVKLLFPILKDVFSALHFLEREGVVHYDIKEQNIFLYQSNKGKVRAKLGDFGLSRKVEELRNLEHFQGSLLYLSPERAAHFFDENLFPTQPFKADIWSAGFMVYFLMTRKHFVNTFRVESEEFLENLSKLEQETIDQRVFPDSPLTPLLRKMLQVDSAKRFTALESLKELKEIKCFFF